MTSNISTLGPSTVIGDAAASGVSRSRFSFHINTPRRRRWVLVQLVSVADNSVQNGEVELYHSLHSKKPPPSLGRLVDDYRMTHSLTRWV